MFKPYISLRGKIASRPFGKDQSVRATHLIIAGVGDDGSLCPGLLLFRQYRQKVHESARGGIPLSLSGRLPNWVYYMYKSPRDPNWMYCMYKTPKSSTSTAGTRPGTVKREYCRIPTWDAPKVS